MRDDLGKYKDNSPVNYEVSYSRGISEGIYVINLHLYREDETPFVPIIAKLVVSVVDPDTKEENKFYSVKKNFML